MKLCKCNYCLKEFEVARKASKYCSSICRSTDYAKINKDKVIAYKISYYDKNKKEINDNNMLNYYTNKQKLEKRICDHCGIEYQPTRTDRKFCSDNCGTAHWYSHNKEYIKTWSKDRYHTDINHKLRMCLRSRLNKALKGNVKSQATMQLLGCSIEELKTHLESQFESWMTWDNHGIYNPNKKTWNVDHIRPMASFDLSDPIQQQDACNYTNLKPLLAKSNLIKGAKYE